MGTTSIAAFSPEGEEFSMTSRIQFQFLYSRLKDCRERPMVDPCRSHAQQSSTKQDGLPLQAPVEQQTAACL
jgi:hypothetical protein